MVGWVEKDDVMERRAVGGSTEGQIVQEFGRVSTGWRTAIDELTGRFDCAHQDLKETIQRRLDLTQKVYVAARSWGPDTESETDDNLRFLMAYLIRDLREAYETAASVVGGSGQASDGSRHLS
jgi:hypothetical protein